MEAKPIKTPISDTMLQTVIRGGQFVDQSAAGEWMGPQRNLEPVTPPEVEGRVWDYPLAFNLRINPREQDPVSYEQLRTLADSLDILRLVIETRKDLVCAVPYEIRPKKKDGEKDNRCFALETFFAKPDRFHAWPEWLRMLLEDLFVIDAPAIYKRRTKGGKLYALEPIDGATIVRKIDQFGRTPFPPDTAYQQKLKGSPGPEYTIEELIFRPRNVRTSRAYGYSPVEQIIMTVNTALRRQLSQQQFYTEGSTPDFIMSVPPTWTTKQIREFQERWNDELAGNTGERRKTKFVPGDVKPINTKEGMLKDEFDEWLARIVTYAFSMTNMPFVKQMNRATSETAQEQAINEGLAPILGWVKMIVDMVIAEDFNSPDLHLVWVDTKDPDPVQEADARKTNAEADKTDIESGVLDINEVRVSRGLPELTPEQLEKRKPAPPPALAAGKPGDDPDDDDNPPTPGKGKGTAEKIEKKKAGNPVPHIDRDRNSVSVLKAQLYGYFKAFFAAKGADIAAQASTAYDALNKADQDKAAEIIESLVLDWADLVPDLAEHLIEITKDGVVAAAAQLEMTDAGITDLAFTRAEAWARDRAAEMVGMKWIDGELVTNPNPAWSITQTTRDMIYVDVNRAIEEGWSNDQLAAAIKENAAFSDSRAMLVAETETHFADVSGNEAFYKETGIKEWEWFTAEDERVCPVCASNHEQVREIGKEFPSGHTKSPAHPRCHCDMLPVVED